MARRSRKSDPQLPPIDELPSRGVELQTRAPDRECFLCHRPGDHTLGPVTKDHFGFLLHFTYRVQITTEMARRR
jgi:hypothetical protein